ncbi:MAG TPA: dTDP-4-dehydrorhamnose reductase [Bryobacteraceae bacterium]|nr:dTDP-4-dehydrorhamnose reductase [Bryobacteraceae bacterium]
MARILILGANGQLGVELVKEFSARGHRLRPFARRELDITDASKVDEAFAVHNPEIVLNSAAYNQVDVAEKEPLAAWQVNALAVRNLALACRRGGAKLVHFSTDYVFNGLAGRPYREDDAPHPLGAYAVSKLGGELYARAYLDSVLIIRTCGVFGPAGRNTARGNFVELMLRLAAGGKPVRVVEDFVASPTYAPALAERTAQLLERDASGVVHLGGGAPISWFHWASMIFDAAGLKPPLESTNEREYPTAARRPKYSALSNAKAEAMGVAPMPPLKEAIELYFARRG